ncbi:MAG TPA: hypothetical protein VJR27_01160 [Candidatus Saccharimonadales bacterium]|nr:hypothetical protein [Candidatus Saccharimonadales bacterium]
MAAEIRVIQQEPPIIVAGEKLDSFNRAAISAITLGAGKIAVNLEASLATGLQTRAGLLATLGLGNKAIGSMLFASKSTAAKYVNELANGMNTSRTGLAKKFIDCGVYTIRQTCEPLALNPEEQEVVACLAEGFTLQEIDEPAYLKNNAGSNVERIARRTGWNRGPQIPLAALVSRELDGFTPLLYEKRKATQAVADAERAWALLNEPPETGQI